MVDRDDERPAEERDRRRPPAKPDDDRWQKVRRWFLQRTQRDEPDTSSS